MFRRSGIAGVIVAATVVQLGCADGSAPTESTLQPRSASLEVNRDRRAHHVAMQDRCDPATFNAALGDGTCVRRGPVVTFAEFLAEVQRLHLARSWHFEPAPLDIRLGDSFDARNVGGEVHTFTEVEHFGGGIVPLLNQLSGTPEPAPECLQLAPGDFIRPGASTAPDTPSAAGVEHYQCCIHPWMRTDVRIRGG
jgi:hypothetical protein